jgi:hypothetical protein
VLRAGANTLDDPEKGEVLDLMHSAEFRSLTSNSARSPKPNSFSSAESICFDIGIGIGDYKKSATTFLLTTNDSVTEKSMNKD